MSAVVRPLSGVSAMVIMIVFGLCMALLVTLCVMEAGRGAFAVCCGVVGVVGCS